MGTFSFKILAHVIQERAQTLVSQGDYAEALNYLESTFDLPQETLDRILSGELILQGDSSAGFTLEQNPDPVTTELPICRLASQRGVKMYPPSPEGYWTPTAQLDWAASERAFCLLRAQDEEMREECNFIVADNHGRGSGYQDPVPAKLLYSMFACTGQVCTVRNLNKGRGFLRYEVLLWDPAPCPTPWQRSNIRNTIETALSRAGDLFPLCLDPPDTKERKQPTVVVQEGDHPAESVPVFNPMVAKDQILELNQEDWLLLVVGDKTYRVAGKPFRAWSRMLLFPEGTRDNIIDEEWKNPVCPQDLRLQGDIPAHSDWLVSCDLLHEWSGNHPLKDAAYSLARKYQRGNLPYTVLAPGVASGVLVRPDSPDAQPVPGCILLIPNLSEEWAIHCMAASGVISEAGGALAHSCSVAREQGIPVIRFENAAQVFQEDLGKIFHLDTEDPLV